MSVKILNTKNEINELAIKTGGQFLKSFHWAEFQRSCGRKVWHLFDDEADSLLVLIKQGAMGVNYLYSPRGVLTEALLQEVSGLARKNNSVFLRIDPENNLESFKSEYTLVETKDTQPKDCWALKLDKTSEELMAGMKSKTRYNIRLAQKKKVEVIRSTDIKDVGIFYKLSEKTAKRQKIRIHPKEYYVKMFKKMSEDNLISLYFAKYEKDVLAANLVINFGQWATYLHGSTSDKYRNLMAPYLLQWQAVLDAKEKGILYYDFGGISPEGKENHSWAGITRFKMGFGGDRFTHPSSYDIVFRSAKYRLYRLLRLINQVIR